VTELGFSTPTLIVPATLATGDDETREGAEDEVQKKQHRRIVEAAPTRIPGFGPPRA
jgi:hypothetical protein